jgi:hypothetical protein
MDLSNRMPRSALHLLKQFVMTCRLFIVIYKRDETLLWENMELTSLRRCTLESEEGSKTRTTVLLQVCKDFFEACENFSREHLPMAQHYWTEVTYRFSSEEVSYLCEVDRVKKTAHMYLFQGPLIIDEKTGGVLGKDVFAAIIDSRDISRVLSVTSIDEAGCKHLLKQFLQSHLEPVSGKLKVLWGERSRSFLLSFHLASMGSQLMNASRKLGFDEGARVPRGPQGSGHHEETRGGS